MSKLHYKEIHHGPSGKGTPAIAFGDSERFMCFANLSGAYNGNAEIEEARKDFKKVVRAFNSFEVREAAINRAAEWLSSLQLIVKDRDLLSGLAAHEGFLRASLKEADHA